MFRTTPITFFFVPDISLEQYRRLWRNQLDEAKRHFRDLQRIRTVEGVANYLEELNAFDLLTHANDVRGSVWDEIHPDADLRHEAGLAKRAFLALDIEVATSASIADNLVKFETLGAVLDTDSQGFLDEWQRDLRREGAFLSAKGRKVVQDLTMAIQNTADEYLANIRNDDSKLRLHADEFQGVPGDYLVSRTPEPMTGDIVLRHRREDTAPVLQFCEIQATREKVYRFVQSQANPINGPVLHRLLESRRRKARLLGFDNYAEYQLENTIMKSTENVASFLERVHEDVKPRSERETAEITELLEKNYRIDAQVWDMQYGGQLLKRHCLGNFDFKDTRCYFQRSRILLALLKIAEQIFSLRFEAISGIQFWHSSVSACKVYDVIKGQDVLVGRIFFDLCPREGKLDGASAFTVRSPVPGVQLGEAILIANVSNRPAACMTYRQIQNLLHELGHCIHTLVAPHRHVRFAGMGRCPVDFVEVPAQLVELLLTEFKLLGVLVDEEGEEIPKMLLDQLLAADGMRHALDELNELVLARYAVSHILNPSCSARHQKRHRDTDKMCYRFRFPAGHTRRRYREQRVPCHSNERCHQRLHSQSAECWEFVLLRFPAFGI